MAHINLLPWREKAKQESKQRFMTLLVLVAVVSFLSVFSVSLIYDARITGQLARNQYLINEIAILDQQIAEIRDLNEKKKELQKRMNLVAQLQQSRNVGTQIMNAVSEVVPQGVYLVSLERTENVILVRGKSESNNRLANMMRNIEQSDLLINPVMESIVAGTDTSLLSDFVMRVNIATVDLAQEETS